MAQERNEERGRSGATRQIRDVMTPDPECVRGSDTLRDAARIMKDRDTGVVPVVDGKKVVGLITDRDIVIRCVAEGKDPQTARVEDVMTTSVRKIQDDASIDEALTVMKSAEVRRVPVVNGKDEIVGIVSIGDIATDSRQSDKVGKAMEDIAEAPPNN